MEFTDLNLIYAVKNTPPVYASKQYKTPKQRLELWNSIGESLDTPADICIKRWRSIRDRYTKHLKRLKFAKENNEKYDVNWECFDELKFLEKYVVHRHPKHTNPDDPDTASPRQNSFTNIKDDNTSWTFCKSDTLNGEEDDDVDFSEYTTNDPLSEERMDASYQSCKSNQNEMSLEITRANSFTDELSSGNQQFCNSIACSLAKLSRVHNMKAKVEICQVLEKYIAIEDQ